MNIGDLKTGDILLFDEAPSNCCMGILDKLIKSCTESPYSHSGVILRDPPWVSSPGLYVWESSYHGNPDPQDGLVKFGVQITPLSQYTRDYPGEVRIFARKCQTPSLWTREKIEEIHKKVYGKAYDILPQDWFEALIQVDLFEPRTSTFFCSALVAYMLCKIGILSPDTNWTMISPQQLSSKNKRDKLLWLQPYGRDRRLRRDTK